MRGFSLGVPWAVNNSETMRSQPGFSLKLFAKASVNDGTKAAWFSMTSWRTIKSDQIVPKCLPYSGLASSSSISFGRLSGSWLSRKDFT